MFNEIYGSYYRAVEQILKKALEGGLTRKKISEIAAEEGFAESSLVIPDALMGGDWPLLDQDLSTPLKRPPEMPLTTLEKRWLKTLLQDPRIRLFAPDAEGFEGAEPFAPGSAGFGLFDPATEIFEDAEPLYDPGMIEYFDRYEDGDPYEDETYIRNFRVILQALREKRKLEVRFTGQRGIRHIWVCVPLNLEYSSKDDKFRLLARRARGGLNVINLARITSCEILEHFEEAAPAREDVEKETVVMELTNRRNTLERAMLHFSHFAKETERIGEGRYRLTVEYDKLDATEMLIRVLGFGPTIRVVSPDSFIDMIKERIEMQKDCGLL